MAVRLGDSLLLSTSGASRVSCTSAVANVAVPAVRKHGDQCGSVTRLAGGRTLLGGLPSLKARAGRNGSRKRLPAIRATKSVDAPESPPSPSASKGTFTLHAKSFGYGYSLCTLILSLSI
jgi:hypothetical protein